MEYNNNNKKIQFGFDVGTFSRDCDIRPTKEEIYS